MSTFDDLSFSTDAFSGKARLFPLPNLVLFPHVMQPLHVFESRYRELLEDALADDRLIAMSVLTPGWEKNYEGRPVLYSMACLARITTHIRLPDGAYNVLLLGVHRVRLLRELKPVHQFRQAEVELCADVYPHDAVPRQKVVQRRLRDALVRFLPALPEAEEQLDQLLGNDVPLAVLTDVVSYMLDIKPSEKQLLLGEVDVLRRTELLLTHLERKTAVVPGWPDEAVCFPPQFSEN